MAAANILSDMRNIGNYNIKNMRHKVDADEERIERL